MITHSNHDNPRPLLSLLHYDKEKQSCDCQILVGPAEVSLVDLPREDTPDFLLAPKRFELVEAWEVANHIPTDHQANSILGGHRGGNKVKLYHCLVKQGLEGKVLPAQADMEEEDDDFVVPEAKRLKGVASPMSKTPSEYEREKKRHLEQLAYAHPAWMRKVEIWKKDFEKAITNLRSEGWVTERDEDENILACTDRGAAIKAGRAKAKAEREKTTKAQVRKEAKVDKVDKVNTDLEHRESERNIELWSLKSDLAQVKAELIISQNVRADLATTNKELNTTIAELKTKTDKLFQFLCKEEAKSGHLQGELVVYRAMFANNNKCAPPKQPPPCDLDKSLNMSGSPGDPLSGMLSGRNTGQAPSPINYSSQFLNMR